MREIKFRAFDTKVNQPMWDTEGCLSLIMLQNRVANGDADDEGRLERFKLMQYTGLKDKNGVEIYEGDIVKHSFGQGVIEFRNAAFVFIMKDRDIPYQLGAGVHSEVIGNIHQHKELIDD